MIRISDRDNLLNRAGMLRYYLLAKHPSEDNDHGFSRSSLDDTEELVYPAGFREFFTSAGSKPLFTLSEQIIDFFDLNKGEVDMACLNFFQDQVLDFMTRRSSDLKLFTDWWIAQGRMKSVILSGEQDALRIMTIHKAKGLQFKVVIIPFISWNFDQKSGNLMWVQPGEEIFNSVGAFPVGYSSSLEESIFRDDYMNEKRASYLDNLNLLYVAFTRASERLYGFASSRKKGDAGNILRSGLESETTERDKTICLKAKFDSENGIFETGSRGKCKVIKKKESLVPAEYPVFEGGKRLKLRLYGQDLLKDSEGGLKSKIYYGTVLHDIFSRIKYRRDVAAAIESAVADGYIPAEISLKTREMVLEMISRKNVEHWFNDDVEVLTEPEILTGTGDIRRPDRVVIKDGKLSVIDYKFGEERSEHIGQIENYRNLLTEIGHTVEEACLWYVETDKIIRV